MSIKYYILEVVVIYCPQCNNEINKNDKFCSECGAEINKDVEIEKDFSEEWERCPRCGSNKVENTVDNIFGVFFGTIILGIIVFAALYLISLYTSITIFYVPPKLAAIGIGIMAVWQAIKFARQPEFKCKECGAAWNRKENHKNNDYNLKFLNEDDSFTKLLTTFLSLIVAFFVLFGILGAVL